MISDHKMIPLWFSVNGEEEADANITYFVDEEGRYYYQSAGDSNQIVSLPTAVSEEAEDEVHPTLLL